MGGFGSGQRWNSKATTSDYDRLDVRNWQRERRLVSGRFFAYQQWNVEVLAFKLGAQPDRISLVDRSGLRYSVSLAWTRCNYGGSRAWFVCPTCRRRVAILYGVFAFACRNCRQLAYDSQQDSGWNRSLRQARTVRMRLGGSANLAEPLPGKPKGMHWRTYRRLYLQAAGHEEMCFGGAMSMLTSLEKSNSRSNGRVQ
jgi:hypothetical protein